MILASLENISEQVRMTPNLANALAFLAHANPAELPDGRVDVDGDRVYALIQRYETLPAGEEVSCEGHQRYIDVQYIVEGEECMGWAPESRVRSRSPYDPVKDIWRGKLASADMVPVVVRAGEAAVFYPGDVHAPKLAVTQPASVVKICVKVRLEE
ncbi:MAG: YhcH/YjgK/YiaL family protein [Anaerolineaceae bacterium]